MFSLKQLVNYMIHTHAIDWKMCLYEGVVGVAKLLFYNVRNEFADGCNRLTIMKRF